MSTRGELLRAHRFRLRRLVNAICSGHPDEPPSRLGAAVAVGVVGSVLAFAGVTVHARLVRPAGWRRSDVIIVERETGREFVYRDGRLHAVPNLASARLAVGRAAPLVAVARNALRTVPAGATWGIAGAPAQLPAAADLAGSWTLCSVGGTARLVLGGAVGGGRLGSRGVAVSGSDGSNLVLTRDVLRPGPTAGMAVPVAPELLASVPADPSAPLPHTEIRAPGTLCAIHDGDGTSVMVNATAPPVRVTVASGSAALVSSDADPASVALISDDGRRYPLAGSGAIDSLGYAGVAPLALPVEVLALIPEGPRLSTADARRASG